MIAPYDDLLAPGQPPRTRLLLVRYPDAERASRALAHFRSAYLPETGTGAAKERGSARTEEGWTSWRLLGRGLAIVFSAPDEKAGASLLEAVSAEPVISTRGGSS